MSEKEKNSELYSAAVIEKYLEGKLSATEMHAIEKAALDDPFLADAIEGMNQSIESRGSSSLDMDIAELRQRLKQRIANNRNKVIPITPHRNWLQIAAVFFILIFSGMMTYYYIHNNSMEKRNIAQENKSKQPINDSPHAETSAPAPVSARADSGNFETPTSKKPKTSRAISNSKKTNAPEFQQDTVNAVGDIAREREQYEPKKEASGLVAKDEDKSAGKASRSDYFAPSPKQKSFMGRVTDEYNKPIAAASIELKNKKITSTDDNGNFKLNVEKADSTVEAKVISYGYLPTLADLSPDGSTNIVLRRANKSNLQEVMITDMDKRRKNSGGQLTTQDAAPIEGWDEYNKYLEKNKKPPQDSLGLRGPVVVSFIVNKKGTLSNFAIEQSLGDDYDAEAIRVIKEGPAWKLLKGKKANITVIVNY